MSPTVTVVVLGTPNEQEDDLAGRVGVPVLLSFARTD